MELEAVAAKEVIASAYTVKGTLSSSTQVESNLEGMLTVQLTLRITILDKSSNIKAAFELLSRGGGFNEDAAMHQALERMQVKLQSRLEELNVGGALRIAEVVGAAVP